MIRYANINTTINSSPALRFYAGARLYTNLHRGNRFNPAYVFSSWNFIEPRTATI
ncbi:MAG: hypothetical protein IPP72_21520 [Chitinophagaceae bacterium]|nr:hypothetical protein [Chitinophagaceae bacterium]